MRTSFVNKVHDAKILVTRDGAYSVAWDAFSSTRRLFDVETPTPLLHSPHDNDTNTTTPYRTHPSTRLIEEVLESIHRLAGVGPDVKKVIVADGVKVRESSKFRAGVVTAEDDAGYRHYLERVHHLTRTPGSSLHGAELIALDERHGFAHALRRGLMRVSTPFVLVAQHDR